MDRLYVDPLLSRQREKGSGGAVTLTDWLATLRNGVILGNPGAGKSSLSIRVCHQVAMAPEPVLGGCERLPFIVKLRDYSAAKRERPLSLADFIAEEIHTSLQLPHAPMMVEHLLLRGSMFIAFDGLDELLDANHRQEIRDEVESFSRRYPNTFLLVTSREVGYPLAALDDDRFTVAWLNDFDRPRVERYAQKWFALDDELSPDERDAKTEAFLRESETVSDVRSNPLMLALMCNLYRGQGYIPRNRPEVYEKCATMLFDVWDRRRAIKVYLPISGHVEPAMNDLARWIYEDEVRQTGVTERQLIERTTAYLHTWRFTDVHKARKAARSFVEFCRGRAWVFTDTGTTGDGEALYQFTHRTFLEYFAARQLVASHDTLTELIDDVLPHVERGEWDVVAQLAFQIKARSSEGGADALFVGVLEYLAAAGADEALNIATFLCQCLGFMFPRPATVARVAQAVTNNLCERGTTVERWLAVQALAMAASEENRDAVREGVDQVISEGIGEGRQAAIELLLGLDAVIPLSRRSSEDTRAVSFWERARKHLVNRYRTELAAAVQEDMTLASLACGTHLVGLEDHVKRYGLQAAVIPRLGAIWRAGYRLDLQHVLARATLGAHRSWVRNGDLAYLSDLMLSAHRPWVSADAAVQAGDGDQLGTFEVRRKYRSDQADEVFVGFCLAAAVQELWPRASWLSSCGALGSVVSNRGRPRQFGVTIELQKMEQILREEQFAFAEAWLNEEIALVAR